jgi:hypothetical protein
MIGNIARKWEAKVARADLAEWVKTYRDRVLDDVLSVNGFVDVTFLAERKGDPCKVTAPTAWRDMDAVGRFAGDDPARRVLPGYMARFFPDYDVRATRHDQLLTESRP